MAVYSYTRSSEIEAFEVKSEIDGILEKEDLHTQTFALKEGMSVIHSFADNNVKWSLDFIDREKGISLLNKLEAGDVVLTYSVERMFSSCEDLYKTINAFQKMKVKLIVTELEADITTPEFCPSFLSMLNIFSHLEKRRSTERIKSVKRNQRDKGRFLGGSRPFGYMIHSNGRLIENPMEQQVLKRILKMKTQGKSLRAISSEVSTPIVPVSFKTVQRLIKRHEAQVAAQVH